MDIEFIHKQLNQNEIKSRIDGYKYIGKEYKEGPIEKSIYNLADKITKIISHEKKYILEDNNNTIVARLKKKFDSEQYSILKIDESNNKFTIYINIYTEGAVIKFGVAVIEGYDNSNIKVTLFSKKRLGMSFLNLEKTLLDFDKFITVDQDDKDITQTDKNDIENNENSMLNPTWDSYKKLDQSIFPLKENLYLDREYIHPAVNNDLVTVKSYDTKEYEKAKRIVLNNNYQLNTLNKYVPAVIASNIYQENHFPIIGEKPDLEEFTSEYVWFDEKIYLHTVANEYVTYDTPDIYMSTTTSFGGNVAFGTISKAQSGKKDAGWSLMSSGDFYITERQILIFERGGFSLGSFLFGGDNLKRNVFPIYLSDIKLVEGDSKLGALKIYRKDNKVHAFGKSNHNRNEIKFSEDELRYMVNLIGSLIEKL